MKNIKSLGLALAALTVLCSPQLGANSELIKLRAQVFQEKEVVDASGLRKLERVPATRFTSGSEVIYEVAYSNAGPRPAQVVITNPLPSDLVFQSYAARSVGAALEVSFDQARSFSPLAGVAAERYAQITHVRWKILRAVQPGEAGYVSLRARLR